MTDRVNLVRRAYEAFGNGDVPAVAAMLAETEWHEAEGMPYGGVYKGPMKSSAKCSAPSRRTSVDRPRRQDREIRAVRGHESSSAKP
jgi:hypothetical protein